MMGRHLLLYLVPREKLEKRKIQEEGFHVFQVQKTGNYSNFWGCSEYFSLHVPLCSLQILSVISLWSRFLDVVTTLSFVTTIMSIASVTFPWFSDIYEWSFCQEALTCGVTPLVVFPFDSRLGPKVPSALKITRHVISQFGDILP